MADEEDTMSDEEKKKDEEGMEPAGESTEDNA